MKTQFLTLVAALLTLLGVSACNTIEGMGRDIGASGEAIEDTAKENKNY